MSKVKIYQPAKNAMQSGMGKSGVWLLEFIPSTPYWTDGLMGWNGMTGTQRELRLKFPSKESAIAYAHKENLEFEVFEPNQRCERRKAYADIFAFNRVRV
jgi:hypothetical protein